MTRSNRASALLVFVFSLFFTLCTGRAAIGDPLPVGSVAGDFNADGRLDVLVQPADANHPGRIVLRDGTGALSVQVQVIDASFLGLDWVRADSVAHTGDFDGDGRADVLLQSKTKGGVQAILLTDATSQLNQIAQKIPANYMGVDWSSSSHQLVVGDFNGDGRSDVLLQPIDSNDVTLIVKANTQGILNTTGQGWMQNYLGRDWSAKDVQIYSGDFNGDGNADLLLQTRVGHRVAGQSDYALIMADSNGEFTDIAQTWNSGDLGADWSPTTHALSVRDINGDGIADIVLTSSDGRGSNYAFLGNNGGVFNKPAVIWQGSMSAEEALRQQGNSSSSISVSSSLTTSTPKTMSLATTNTTMTTLNTNFATASLAGTMAGTPGVSGGAATYTIPITLPPGRAGMQPSVSLTYSSRGGNGNVGIGWSISAGSEISRCPATKAQDPYSSGVMYTHSDRLCLDGQRLIIVSGTYGQTGSVYRTELDSFVKVTLTGDIDSASAEFKVQQKDGQIAYYGAGSDTPTDSNAVFTAHNAPYPMVWAIAVKEDTYNNSVIYHYWSPGNGEYLLGQIDYTGSGTTAGNRYVAFDYTTRSDVGTSWLAGGLTDQTQVLQDVRTSNDGSTQVLQYNMQYNTSAATGRALLAGVQQCGYVKAAGTQYSTCLPASTFSWHAPALSFNSPQKLNLDLTSMPAGMQVPQVSLHSYGDFNGDGRKDLVFFKSDVSQQVLMTRADGSGFDAIDVSSLFGNLFATNAADINGDGAVDLVGAINVNADGSGGTLAYSSWNGSSFDAPVALPGISFPDVRAVTDVDGDGKPDIVTVENGTAYCYLHSSDNSTPYYSSKMLIRTMPTYTDPVTGNTLTGYLKTAGDIDGNGLPDFFVTGTRQQVVGVIFTIESSNGTLSFPYKTYSELHLDADAQLIGADGSASSWPSGYFMDINGDGLPDYVFDCSNRNWCYQLNTGAKNFGTTVDTGVADDRYGIGLAASLQGDLDNDGTEEIIYPSALLVEYCERDTLTGTTEVEYTCATSGSGTTKLPTNQDFSIYGYSVLKFVPESDASVADGSGVKYVPNVNNNSNIVSQANLSVLGDIDGDGLMSVIAPFTKWYDNGAFIESDGSYGACPSTYPCGLSVSRSTEWNATGKDSAPDMMLSATNGFGVSQYWDYYPLSSSVAFNSNPLYYAPAIGSTKRTQDTLDGYFYFTSSMYVVGEYRESNGVGGTNSDDFHYARAIYQSKGRGFQGFKVVADENNATGIRSVQVYHQHFPLSGQLEESWTNLLSAGLDLSDPQAGSNFINDTQYTVECQRGSAAPAITDNTFTCKTDLGVDAPTYLPILKQSIATEHDVKTGETLSTTTIGFSYDMFGNTTSTQTTVTDGSYVNSSSAPPGTTYTRAVTNVITNNESAWWLGRLDRSTTSSSVTYSSDNPGSTMPDTVTAYEYDPTSRAVTKKTVMPDVAAYTLETDYGYDSFGNTKSVTVSGGSGDTAIISRKTTMTYTGDGYFMVSVTDPAGLVTTTEADPRTGEPLTVKAPDGVVTNYTYDPLGRKLSSRVTSSTGRLLPVENTSYATAAADCQAGTQLAVVTTRSGYPGHTVCKDMLGRTIRTVAEGFDASKPTYVDTIYDTRGRVTTQSVPHFSTITDPPTDMFTYDASIDPLGRLTHKYDAKGIDSSYSYSGLSTTVSVIQTNDSRTRTTTETHNALGKLVSTVDTNGSDTEFRYDAHGNPIYIKDAANNVIQTTYNVLDQKISVDDPDQGHSSFVYDVLGELKTQTDAKGQTITQGYDLDGRMTSRSRSDGISASWVYDACTNGAGKLCSVSQSDGYAEAYTYDDLGRVTNLDTTINGTDYNTSTTYDTDGRVQTVTYPELAGVDAVPHADAGSDQSVALPSVVGDSATIILDGSGSTNPTSKLGTLRYHWSQLSGPSVTLTGASTATPSFMTATVGVYVFGLTVNNDFAQGQDTVTITVTPAQVTGLSVASTKSTDGVYSGSTMLSTTGSYTLAWTAAINGATSFEILQSTDGGHTYGTPSPASSPDPFYGMGSQTENITYTYEVVGCASGICGPPSDPANIIVELPPGPPASISLPATSSWDGSFPVHWGAAAGSVSVYHVQIGEWDSEMQRYDWHYASCGGAPTDTSCSIAAGKLADGIYAGHVFACNDRACGTDTIASNDITVNIIPLPAAPSLSGTTTTYTGSVSLNWSAPTNATGYQLYAQYYSKSSGSWGSYGLKYSGSGRSWSQTLTSDQKYAHYYVKACDQAGCSGASNTVTTTYSAPIAPGLSGPTQTTTGSISLIWSAPAGAKSYQLYSSYQSRVYGTWTSTTLIYSGAASSYTDTISTGKSYASYYVRACNAMGCGADSNTVNVPYSLTGGGGGGCGASCGGCGKVLCLVMLDPNIAAPTRRVPRPVPLLRISTVSPIVPLLDPTFDLAIIPDELVPNATGQPTTATRLATLHTDQNTNATEPADDGVTGGNALAMQYQKRLVPRMAMNQGRSFTFAPPAYQYYAAAEIKPASTTTIIARFTVAYEYTSTGYLSKVENALNTSEVYWQATATDARGQVSAETFGNGIQSTRTYDSASGYLTAIQSGQGGGNGVQNLSYAWEPLGNLTHRGDANRNLTESFSYDTLNRLTGGVLTTGGNTYPSSYAYDAIGNITSKSDIGTYTYGIGAGPHAVTSVTGLLPGTYQYDANGNMTSRNGTAIGWNADNLPTSIVKDSNNSSTFSYAPDKHRYYQVANDGGVSETTTYVGNMEIVTSNGITDYHQRINAYGRDVAQVILSTDSTRDKMTYILTDHLGSIDVTTDSTGNVISGTGWSFSAFGTQRRSDTWNGAVVLGAGSADRQITHRGFTNQEMLDNVALIHMNGRVYDPNLGRFLSVDPVFEFPTNTQSLNPYSYVLNNPLSMTDPTGYVAACPTGESTCSDSTLKAGDTAHVSYTPTGSHIATTVTATVQKDGSVAITSNSPQAAQAIAKNASAMFGNGGSSTQSATSAQTKPTDTAGINSPANVAKQPSVNILNHDVPITLADNKDSQKEQKGLIGDLNNAAKLINKHARQFSGREKAIIHMIKSIRIENSDQVKDVGVQPGWPGRLILTKPYISSHEGISTPWLASEIAHDGYHFLQYDEGIFNTPNNAHAMERAADLFQIEVGRKLGLSAYDINYLLRDNHTGYDNQ